MSWWKTLAALGGDFGGAFIGDPLLGHQVMGVVNAVHPDTPSAGSSLLGTAGAMAGGASAGRAQGRIDEASIQQAQDRLALERSRQASLNTASQNNFNLDAATTEIARRKYALEAPGARAGNAVRGDILAHAQDATVDPSSLGPNVHVPTISGGLRPSMFSDSTRQLGGLMSDQALQGQQAGDTFDPLTYQQPAPIPGLTPLPQSGVADTILNTAGAVGTGMDAFLQWLQRYKASQPQQPKSTPQVQGPSGLLDPMSEGNYA